MVVKQVQNGAMSSIYAGSKTNTEVKKNLLSAGINCEAPVIMVYTFLFCNTEKKISQSYE